MERDSRHVAYVRGIVSTVLALLPGKATMKEVAESFGQDGPWIANRLNPSRQELEGPDVRKIEKALKAMAAEAIGRSSGKERAMCEDAIAIVSAGLDRGARSMASLLPAAGRERVNAKTAEEVETRERLRAALSISDILETEGVPNPEAMLGVASKVWPSMVRAHLGHAYFELADFLRRNGRNERDEAKLFRASAIFREAEQRHISSIYMSALARAKCYISLWRVSGLRADVEEGVRKEAEDLFNRVELMLSFHGIECLERAELMKWHAEWERHSGSSPGHQVPMAYGRSAHLFQKAALEFEKALPTAEKVSQSGRTDDSRSVGHVSHNAGYCRYRSSSPKAVLHFESAAKSYADADRTNLVAYNMVYLALAFEEAGESLLAVWCIRCSIGLYRLAKERLSSDNFAFAVTQQRRIENEPITSTMPSPDPPMEAESTAAYAGRIWAEYARVRDSVAARTT